MNQLTTFHLQILHLLTITMVSPALLVQGGIFYTPQNIYKTNLRNAQRTLKKLSEAGYIASKSYLSANNFCLFYYPTEKTFQSLKKETHAFHEIHENIVDHDSLTALFLIHAFRWNYPENICLRFLPPFAIGDKQCDGLLQRIKDNKIIQNIVLETDTGTHDHQEIREKMKAYKKYLQDNPTSEVAFLISSDGRRENLQTTIGNMKEIEMYFQNINFICPYNLPPDG